MRIEQCQKLTIGRFLVRNSNYCSVLGISAAWCSAWFMDILCMWHFWVTARGNSSLLPALMFSSSNFDAVQLCWESVLRLWFWALVSSAGNCSALLYQNCYWPRYTFELCPVSAHKSHTYCKLKAQFNAWASYQKQQHLCVTKCKCLKCVTKLNKICQLQPQTFCDSLKSNHWNTE